MRVLLRKTGNGCYYQDPGQWVTNPEKGFDFGSIFQALEWADKISLEDMELALAFDSSHLISAISLKSAQAELSRKRL